MKTVAITQRVDVIAERGERRDALDQRWHPFLAACGLMALPLPNHADTAKSLLASTPVAGIILSGGNDLARFGGDVPERDATEAMALDFATHKNLPIVGVCRGLQFLADQHKAALQSISGHVDVRHSIKLAAGGTRSVNSYHRYGILTAPAGWQALATAPDGSVEWIMKEKMHGIMWHPEREKTPAPEDIALFREIFA